MKYYTDKNNPIHFIKRIIVKSEIKKIPGIKDVADLGCGCGVLCHELKGYNTDGYDLIKDLIEEAKEVNESSSAKFYCKNLFEIKDKKYDLVVATEMVEYIKDDVKALKKMNSLLRKDGYLILTIPVNEKFGTKLEAAEGFKRYSREEIKEKLEKAGFKLVKTRYWGFPLINQFYLRVYVPSSMKKKKTGKRPSFAYINLLRIMKYFFMIDLLFNTKNSFDMMVVAKKT
ncbi:MAG: class I SAM-dependent methyltransferase [bacterium]|nr:class I SAM-dependent methyltransferase [bacterium]